MDNTPNNIIEGDLDEYLHCTKNKFKETEKTDVKEAHRSHFYDWIVQTLKDDDNVQVIRDDDDDLEMKKDFDTQSVGNVSTFSNDSGIGLLCNE